MENHPILRSLVADGRPLGTGRPATSSPRNEAQNERFEERLEDAQRAKDEQSSSIDERGATRRRDARARRAAASAREQAPDPLSSSRSAREPQAQDDTQPGLEARDALLQDTLLTGEASTPASSAPAPADPASQEPLAKTVSGDAAAEQTSEEGHPVEVELEAATPAVGADGAHKLGTNGERPTAKAAPTLADDDGGTPALERSSADELAALPEPTTNEVAVESEPGLVAKRPAPELSKLDTTSEPQSVPAAPRGAAERVLQGASEPDKSAAAREIPVSADRAADILRQIKLQLSPELRQATIQLEPRELGRIAIKVALRGDAVHAQMRVDKRETLEALEKQVPELRAALERAGFGREVQLQLSLNEQRSGGDGARETPKRSLSTLRGVERPSEPRALQEALARRISNPGGVDTYA